MASYKTQDSVGSPYYLGLLAHSSSPKPSYQIKSDRRKCSHGVSGILIFIYLEHLIYCTAFSPYLGSSRQRAFRAAAGSSGGCDMRIVEINFGGLGLFAQA